MKSIEDRKKILQLLEINKEITLKEVYNKVHTGAILFSTFSAAGKLYQNGYMDALQSILTLLEVLMEKSSKKIHQEQASFNISSMEPDYSNVKIKE